MQKMNQKNKPMSLTSRGLNKDHLCSSTRAQWEKYITGFDTMKKKLTPRDKSCNKQKKNSIMTQKLNSNMTNYGIQNHMKLTIYDANTHFDSVLLLFQSIPMQPKLNHNHRKKHWLQIKCHLTKFEKKLMETRFNNLIITFLYTKKCLKIE